MSERVFLDRSAILDAADLGVEEVYVPEWGGWVRVRGMTGAERDQFEAEIVQQRGRSRAPNLQNIRAKLVARCTVDGAGARVFSDADIEALGRKSAAALDRVFEVAQRLSGVTREAVEELAGNSETEPSDGSTSA